ncbi:regulator of chromosome condensation 1/beta-lactamase-inhibitor protein II [Gilbertella persicaria]|uniref:regulator of chromosome condensation 1/beta-lactamase-inhibitor protein II n=1 Tax=Gilbertella persicaria TaxID=101096 RepID=UPI0022208F82|nr:regulator of chromosome condensation 1/beta-lactamase-inhibitor protein II [Gilbertella persicaria]KAI8059069.1 regulator of chromosome condensation 1/beta-lactamase-inhibitor protein II [Gilbertella persicaria]
MYACLYIYLYVCVCALFLFVYTLIKMDSALKALYDSTAIEAGSLYIVGRRDVAEEEETTFEFRDMTHPIRVPGLEDQAVTEVSAGPFHTIALTREGMMYSWGDSQYGALGREGNPHVPQLVYHPSIRYIRFIKVACGSSFSMALSSRGLLYTWGTFMSQEGIYGYLPNVKIQTYPRIVNKVSMIRFINIAAGAAHCLALDDQGGVYSWGCGENEQLGVPMTRHQAGKLDLFPLKVALNSIVSIACGQFHSLAINRRGQVFAWGVNKFQQCGMMEKPEESHDEPGPELVPVPQLIPKFRKSYAPLALGTVGSLKSKASEAQRMISTMTSKDGRFKEEEIGTRLNITEDDPMEQKLLHHDHSGDSLFDARPINVAAGAEFSIVQTDNHSLIAFGRNDHGQLGILFDKDHPCPGAIKSKKTGQFEAIGYPHKNPWSPPEGVKKVASGFDHAVVISTEGRAWGYGATEHHQLGLYTTKDAFKATLIESILQRGRVLNAAGNDTATYFVVV